MIHELAGAVIETVHIIYPEDVWVAHHVVLGWAHDELVNAAVYDHVKQHGVIPEGPDGERIYEAIASRHPRPTDIDEAIAILDDCGSHTFARRDA